VSFGTEESAAALLAAAPAALLLGAALELDDEATPQTGRAEDSAVVIGIVDVRTTTPPLEATGGGLEMGADADAAGALDIIEAVV